MSVCDINPVNACKGLPDHCNLGFLRNDPDPVPHFSLRNKITNRSLLLHSACHGIDRLIVTIGKKNRTRLGIAGIHVPDPVLLLCFYGVLMLLDYAALIIVNGGTRGNSGLTASLPGLLIQIKAGLLILKEGSVLHLLLQHFSSLYIDGVLIGSDLFRKDRLCAVNGKERIRMVLYILSGFFP